MKLKEFPVGTSTRLLSLLTSAGILVSCDKEDNPGEQLVENMNDIAGDIVIDETAKKFVFKIGRHTGGTRSMEFILDVDGTRIVGEDWKPLGVIEEGEYDVVSGSSVDLDTVQKAFDEAAERASKLAENAPKGYLRGGEEQDDREALNKILGKLID